VHPLADRQRPLGQVVQNPPHGPITLGGGIGAAHLPEHLLLADDGAVQTAGHREEMLDGGFAVPDVGVPGELAHRQAGMIGQHLADG